MRGRRINGCAVLAVVCLFGSASVAWAQQCPADIPVDVVHIAGEVTTPLRLTQADLAGMARATVEMESDGQGAARYEGVPLFDLMAAAGVSMERLRGPLTATVLIVEARDDYRAAFSLAELDESFSGRQIILADRRNGETLDTETGPFRIIVGGDERRSRWIRQVSCIRVVRP